MLNFTPFLDELYTPGQAITATATEEIKLGQLVEIVADEGVHATAHTPQLAVKVGPPLVLVLSVWPSMTWPRVETWLFNAARVVVSESQPKARTWPAPSWR